MEKLLGSRYQIEGKIGAGGMAIVYRARDTLLERTVAVKVLREQFATDEAFVKRFRREAQAAASLSHPNIVSIYDVGRDSDIDYIVMEYVDGQTLKEIIQSCGPLPIQEAIALVGQVGEALSHAHAHRIIHRDIKPQNILVTADGRAKVTDFGIARAVTSATLTHTGDIIGSVHYLSPEQARGAMVTERSDIYSLGIILYELVTGQLPYDGDTPITIALKHLQEIPQLPGQMGGAGELDGVILRAIAKTSDERYPHVKEFLSDLAKIRAGQEVHWAPDEKGIGATAVHKGLAADLAKNNKRKARLFPIVRFGGREIPTQWIVIPAVVILAITVGLMLFVDYVRGNQVVVPDLSGKTLNEARALLTTNRLVLSDEVDEEFSSEVERGRIIGQDLAPKAVTKSGRVVKVTVSKGAEIVTFPDVSSGNPLFENALRLIAEAGFDPNKVIQIEVFSSSVPKGHVVQQSPMAGADWGPEATIRLEVSKGPDQGIIIMPDLVGDSVQNAKIVLDQLKLTYEVVTVESVIYPTNTVMATDPDKGKPVTPGSQVKLTVSKGPGPKP